jgi:hypothetical protein
MPSARMMLPFLPRVKILFRVVFQFVFLVWVTLNGHKWLAPKETRLACGSHHSRCQVFNRWNDSPNPKGLRHQGFGDVLLSILARPRASIRRV